MVRQFIEVCTKALMWGKIIFPLSKLRFYPPQFVVRDPIVQGVRKAFKEGNEAAVIVYNIKNLKDLSEQIPQFLYREFIKKLKIYFRDVIRQEMSEEDIIALHDYYSDGLSFYIRVNHDRHCISEIDGLMKKYCVRRSAAFILLFRCFSRYLTWDICLWKKELFNPGSGL